MANERPVNVGLIGVGGIAAFTHYPGLKTVSGARVIAMTDTEGTLLEQRSKEWPEVRVCRSLEELLDLADLDAVIVATPNSTHRRLVSTAVQAGKHVLCEKPLGMNLTET